MRNKNSFRVVLTVEHIMQSYAVEVALEDLEPLGPGFAIFVIILLAFQFGEGWINPVLPTSGVTMGVLGLAGISWDRWFRWMLPAQVYFFILALVLLIPPYLFHYH